MTRLTARRMIRFRAGLTVMTVRAFKTVGAALAKHARRTLTAVDTTMASHVFDGKFESSL